MVFRAICSLLVLGIVWVQPGCSSPRAADSRLLRLATTTSTRDSGLLDELLSVFERQRACQVDVIAVGTGAALKLGESGEADVVLVHARRAELDFMRAGHGIRHEEFMYNEFVLLGPPSDPAKIRGRDPAAAMKEIADRGHRFVSRGDDSGTHKRELQLWESVGGRPSWEAYWDSGQGMGPTLVMADEKKGYVLADMGTYLRMQDKVELVPLARGGSLRNPYAVMVVHPGKNSRINAGLADAFVEFLLSPRTQQMIAEYRVSGRSLFYPTRLDKKQ